MGYKMEQVGKGMVDLALSPDELKVNMPVMTGEVSNQPVYPYGLCIRLGKPELEKLNVDYSDWTVGDHFHLEAMAKITSIRESETAGGKDCCIELQIVALRGHDEENEFEEDGEDAPDGY